MRRPTVVLITVALLVAAVGVLSVTWRRAQIGDPGPIAGPPTQSPGAPATGPGPMASPSPPTDSVPTPLDGGPDLDALPETPWAKVDLEAIREVMPDNAFWTMAMPTTDPEVEARRAETRERWNREWGKILSSTATAEEIDAYYAERQHVAQDYVEFATYLLAEYGDQLTVRDVGLLKVAIELNLARLERFPRDIVEAHERREAHDAARREWQEQQRLFGDPADR